jgi:hypothetical protein
LLPWLLEPSYDSAMRKLSVPVEHTGTTEDPPDAFEATIAYDHVDVTGKLVRIVWRWVAPAPADIVFPTMPPELADIDLAPDDVVRSGTVMFDADTVDGYADFKRGMYRVRSYVILDGNARRPPATTLRNSGFEFR